MDFVILDGNSDAARKCLKGIADARIAEARAIQKYLAETAQAVSGNTRTVTVVQGQPLPLSSYQIEALKD